MPELAELELESVDLDEAMRAADLAAIVTAHPDSTTGIAATAPLLVDFRGVTRDIEAREPGPAVALPFGDGRG